MASSSTILEPVAIIGIACEFAGDIHCATDLWQALRESRDMGSTIPRDRLDLQSYAAHMFNMDNHGQFYQKLLRAGYFLSNNQWDTFDASFFGLSDAEAGSIDPCHRLLMLKLVHLLDDAGYTMEKVNGSRTSVHIGQFSTDHAMTTSRMEPEYRSRFHGPNSLLYNAAARLSYHFNLQGPNLSLDVACSSSLEAVHLAVQTLRTNEADMAICGGVNGIYAPENFFRSSLVGSESPEGRSRSFSYDANGYAQGDGLGLVLLKRLRDAERDGDRIYCVLHDVLSNHDGNVDKSSYVVPSGVGQARLLTEIYSRTNFDPRRIFYVEAHGTGTPVGDPIEANCLGRFFNRSSIDPPLLIGSVKSNLGHTEGAAGIAGLIKVAMCMHYRTIPPNMHFKSLNPEIEAQRYNLHIVQHLIPFPPYTGIDPVAIGINSFGMGGNNVHAIVEEYQKNTSFIVNGFENDHAKMNNMDSKQSFIFIFSTKSRKSLNDQVVQFNQWLEKTSKFIVNNDQGFFQRVSQQLLLKRTISHAHLAIFVFADRKQLQEQINAFLIEQASPGLSVVSRPTIPLSQKICFVFSGQGPQWWAMGRQLYESEPVFARWIQLIDTEMTKINNGEWRLLGELIETNNENESRINDTNIAQPTLFAVQVALAALLVSWNIYPSTIVSHSAGDQAAAFVAGRLTLQEAVRIVYHRSRLQNRNTRQGGRMLAVSMSEDEVQKKLLKGVEHLVCIAVVNSPRSVTLSGNEKTIDELQQILSTFYPNVFKARLRIENAFHSYQMDRFDVEKELLSSLSNIRGLPLKDPQQMFNSKCAEACLYSSVIGGKLDDKIPVDAHYWWSNVRQCVRFRDAIGSMIQDEAANVFLELSPHPVLATSIAECYEFTNEKPFILPTLKRKEDEQITLLTTVAQLTISSDVWQQYFHSRDILPMKEDEKIFDDFPLYAFNLSSCWYESKDAVMKRLANRIPIHPLLGVRQLTRQTTATWKSLININLPQYNYLKDHKIRDAILFPAVAYLELATAACRQLLSSTDEKQSTIIFEQVKFVKALALTEHQLTEVFTQIVMPMREWFIYSRPWSSAGLDCIRSSGMASVDMIDSFLHQQTLSQYSLSEFTLHAHGRIEIDSIHQKFMTTLTTSMTCNKWSTNDITNIYSYLAMRGYQYGSSFQNVQSLRGTTTEIVAKIGSNLNAINDLSCYHLIHPTLLDACLHPLLTLLPGIDTTYIPVGIEKFISTSRANTSYSNLEICGNYHETICGLGQERTCTVDLLVFPSDMTMEEPISIFQGLIIQQIQGGQSGRWISDKTIFDKLNVTLDLPNIDHTEHLNTIIKDYCMKQVWSDSPIITSVADLLPSPEKIIHGGINAVSNQDLIESVQPFNKMAAFYAQMVLKDLDLNNIDDQYYPLLNACRSLAPILHEEVTLHSIQLHLMQLFNQFPRLKPLLISLNTYGLRLKEIFNGEQTGLDVFLGNDETEQTLIQLKTIISASKTQMLFHVIAQYLQLQHEQNSCSSLSNRRLRVFWMASGEHLDTLPILHLLLNLSRQTGLWIDLHYADLDPIQLTQAEKLFEIHLLDQTRLSITYDETFDLFNSESLENIPVESFDIVFAANKLQGSDDLISSLTNLRRLLVPNGLLLLLELIGVPLYFDLIFGLLDQWWLPSQNTRALSDIQDWTTALRETGGFTIVETVLSQYENTLIIAQKTISNQILQVFDERKQQAWLLFAKNDVESLGHIVASLLPCPNIRFFNICNLKTETIRFVIEMMMAKYKQLYIIFAWPLEQTYPDSDNSDLIFKQHEESILSTLVQILQIIQMKSPCFWPFLFVITQHTQLNVDSNCNVIGSQLIGLVRSLIIEYEQHRLKLIDLQAPSTLINGSALAHALVQYMVTSRYVNNTDEIVLRLDTNENQVRHIACHYEMLRTHEEEKEQSRIKQVCIIPRQDADQQPFRLFVPPSRFLAELTWIQDDIGEELLPGMVKIRVHCVGINFRDVLKVRSLYPHTRTFAQLDQDQPHVNRDTEPGSDFVGTVIHACPTVSFKSGDHVVGFSAHGVFHSHVIVHSSAIVCIPTECPLTDEHLSVMPAVCMTVIYSLKYRVHLQSGQTVLIHAATGGAGQICIQYCQWIGARILATAGTEDKRRFLREYYGVEHVFNSRDTSFVKGVRNILPNGVDVVINSLSGSLLKESIKLLACHGHFVEWGKRDVFDKSQMSLFDLRSDCSFHVIDLSSLADQQLPICTVMLQEMVDLFTQGKLRAIEPTVIYEPSQVIEAFMRCNSAQAMGKAVVRLTSSEQPLQLNIEQLNNLPKDNDIMFPSKVCNQGTILISGGFGGLGLAMSRWMIETRGVKRVVLMSRRTLVELEQSSNPQYDDWLRLKRTINEYQAYVDVVQVDVTNFHQIHDLIERLNRTAYPVRGIIHSAVVAEDRILSNLTQEHLTHVLAAKVRGAWILHQVTQMTHTPLHFFVMFSSIRNHLLEMASAGYNAGNQFLDTLAHYRMTKFNLPALSVSLPAVSGAGMFHRQRDLLTSFQMTQGFELVPTVIVFELIERFHANQKICPCPIIFAVNWQTLHQRRRRLATFHLSKIVEERHAAMKLTNVSTASSGINNTADTFLDRRETIMERIQVAVARLLGAVSVDRILLDRSLVSQGMDSLTSLSLYNWLEHETGVPIPLVDLLQGFSIEKIATVVHNKLQERHQVVVSTTQQQDMNINIIKENEIISSNNSSYTGTENIICLQYPLQCDSSVLFCIAEKQTANTNDYFAFFIDKISKQKSQKIPAIIYIIQLPSMTPTVTASSCARNVIAQMRRIQPRGPYQLVAIRKKPEESIAHEMIEQLKDHSMITNVQLLLLND